MAKAWRFKGISTFTPNENMEHLKLPRRETWLRDKSWIRGSPVRLSFARTNILSSLVWIRFFRFPFSPRRWNRSLPSLSECMSFRSFFSFLLSWIPSWYSIDYQIFSAIKLPSLEEVKPTYRLSLQSGWWYEAYLPNCNFRELSQ